MQKYIHLFGGDPQQVTIIGEPASGGAVQYHGTVYGGSKETDLFIRSIAQSPVRSVADPIYPALRANLFLRSAGVSTIAAARGLKSGVLQQANVDAQNAASFNVLHFTPSVDGDHVPDLPPRAYKQEKYIESFKLIAAHNTDEARFLGNQSIFINANLISGLI